MRFLFSQQRGAHYFKRSVLGFLVTIIALHTFAFAAPRQVEAQMAVTEVGPNLVVNKATSVFSGITSAVQNFLHIKELSLDGIAFGIAKGIVRAMVRSLIQWINSGFQGSPAFVTDFKKFLLNALDQVAGEFLRGTELGFLCSPTEIRIALGLNYRSTFGNKAACTLTGAITNAQNALKGINVNVGINTTSQSGKIRNWQDWFDLTTKPQNNTYGSLAMAQRELNVRLFATAGRKTVELNWGKGFLSWKNCQKDKDGKDIASACKTVTPGDVIADQLKFNLSTGQRSLIEADEINEVISALFAQLALRAVAGAGGLLGLTQETNASGQTYLDQLGAVDSVASSTIAQVKGYIGKAGETENRYIALYQPLINTAKGIEEDANGESCSAAENEAKAATTIRTDVEEKITVAQQTITKVASIKAKLNAPKDDLELLTAIQEFEGLRASGGLHEEYSFPTYEEDVNQKKALLNSIKNRVERELDECDD